MMSVKKKIRSSGGHTNPSYVISIPLQWCKILGLVKESAVYLTLDNDRVIISKDLVTSNQEDKKEGNISLALELESRFE